LATHTETHTHTHTETHTHAYIHSWLASGQAEALLAQAAQSPGGASLDPQARELLGWILRPAPTQRPTHEEILAHPWVAGGEAGAGAGV
jgi:hypothetical protein